MGKRFNSSEIKTTASTRQKQAPRRLVGGIVVDKETNPASYKILSGLQAQGISFDNGMTWNGAAKTLMGALDCGIENMANNFSLVGDQEESLENENIMDDDLYGSLNPAPISANDSFTDPNDPFYQMGDSTADNIQAQRQKTSTQNEKNYISFASRLQTETTKNHRVEEEILQLFKGRNGAPASTKTSPAAGSTYN